MNNTKVTHQDAALSCIFLIGLLIFLLLLLGDIIGFGAFLIFAYKASGLSLYEKIIFFCIQTKWWIPMLLCFPSYLCLYLLYCYMNKPK